LFTACTKEVHKPDAQLITGEDLAQIKSLGFSTDNVQKTEEGFLVEGDILLSTADLNSRPVSPNLLIAQEEQYRTFNLVDASSYSTITVALDNSSAQHQAVFSAALDEAIDRYNAQNLTIKFQRINSRADIIVTAYYQVSNVLGSAGFPSRNGDPYRQVKMNTYHYSTGTGSTNTNYIATIIAHEIGHCIGFRHTDYMNRAYSCRSGGNEGSGNIGAVHIPGTPTGPDANSWMLACIANGVNRDFNANDKEALSYLY
jgi:hypothetical protein